MNLSRELVRSLLAFLGPFNAYDREEMLPALDAHFADYSRASIRMALDSKYFMDQWYSKTPLEIKQRLTSALLAAIVDFDFDFEWLISEADGTYVFPQGFEGRARLIYEEMYRAVFEHWGGDLGRAGLILEDPVNLGIPTVSE